MTEIVPSVECLAARLRQMCRKKHSSGRASVILLRRTCRGASTELSLETTDVCRAPCVRLLLPIVAVIAFPSPVAVELSRRVVIQHVPAVATRPPDAGALEIVAANLTARVDIARLTRLQGLRVKATAWIGIRAIPVVRREKFLPVIERRSRSAVEFITLYSRSGPRNQRRLTGNGRHLRSRIGINRRNRRPLSGEASEHRHRRKDQQKRCATSAHFCRHMTSAAASPGDCRLRPADITSLARLRNGRRKVARAYGRDRSEIDLTRAVSSFHICRNGDVGTGM